MTKKQLKNDIKLLQNEVIIRGKINTSNLVEVERKINNLKSKFGSKEKDLNESIGELKKELSSFKSISRVNLAEHMRQLKEQIKEELKEEMEEKQDERWEMLKDYLKVEEEEYAELEYKASLMMRYVYNDKSMKPVKKTRLVKIKNNKKNDK